MFDLFLGKAPTTNRNMEEDPFPIQRIVREIVRIARNVKIDRRKATSDRRRSEPDYVVKLSESKQTERRSACRAMVVFGSCRRARFGQVVVGQFIGPSAPFEFQTHPVHSRLDAQ